MNQRKCGTCRYFEEGGIAASGWCRHPERQELQHMVLVRKTELACRDGWDHDLWEPREGSGAARPAATRGDGQWSPSAETGSTGADLWSPAAAWRGEDAAGGKGGPAGDVISGDGMRYGPASRDRGAPGSLLAPERSTRDGWSTPAEPLDGHHDESADRIQDETVSLRGTSADRTRAGARQYQSEPSPQEPNRRAPASRIPDAADAPFPATIRPPRDEGGPESARFGAPRFGAAENGWNERSPFEHGRYEPEPVEQSGSTEPFEFTESEDEMTDDTSGRASWSGAPDVEPDEQSETGDPVAELEYEDQGGSLNLPLEVQQEKCCRTCRDFRPTDGGRRGWCNNAFAFEQRTQVDADDLACQGTFGNWWSPTDDWWIERADISDHSTPTPLVDELIREIQERKADNRDSTGMRRKS